LDELLKELVHLSSQPSHKVDSNRLTKVKELIGEVGASEEIARRFGSSQPPRLRVPRRGERGTVILDLLFQLDDGQLVLVEAKFGISTMGRTKDWRGISLVEVSQGKINQTRLPLREQIEQLDAEWIKARIKEIAKHDKGLADALQDALDGDRLKVLEMRSRLDLGSGQPPALSRPQVTDHTELIQEQRKTGRRLNTVERRFARREALGERQLKALAARTEQLKQVASDAAKAQNAAEKKLTRLRKELAELRHTPGKKMTKAQVAARQWRTQAIAELDKKLPVLKQATADAEAALAGHLETVERAEKLTEQDTLAREAEKQFHKEHVLQRLRGGAASGKLSAAERKLLDKRGPPPTGLPGLEEAEELPGTPTHAAPEPAATAADQPASTTARSGQAGSPRAIGAGERALGSPMTADKALDHPLTGQRGATAHDVVDRRLVEAANEFPALRRLPARARVAEFGLKGVRLVARIGRFVFSVLDFANPIFSLLDAVALVDLLAAWLQRHKLEEEREWRLIATYLFSHPEKVVTKYGVSYYTGIGNQVEAHLRARMSYPGYPDNIVHWAERWSDRAWSGFVYSTVDAELERQESNQEDDPYQVKYYADTIPLVSFSDIPPANTKATLISSTNYGPTDDRNRATEGGPARYSPEYNIVVKASTVMVRYTYPEPYLTPFDFMIMKCNNLIASIIEFVSHYDEQIISEMSASDEVFEGVHVYWLQNYNFSAPLDSGAVHAALLNLLAAVRVLSLHAHGRGDSKRPSHSRTHNNGYFRRREILKTLYDNNKQLRGMRPFDFVEAQLAQLLVNRQFSQREEQDIDYLRQLAQSIQSDLQRTWGRCIAPETSLEFNYEGKPPSPRASLAP
jgi:hypothetical protein